MTVCFATLWTNHPYPRSVCSFTNQCAIRMGVALRLAGVELGSFRGAKCWQKDHEPRHTLRAQELANWMKGQSGRFGDVEIIKNASAASLVGKRGIVFIQNGWGPTDHIDLWDGTQLKGGQLDYLSRGDVLWFWGL